MTRHENFTLRRGQVGAITLLVGVILVLVASMLGAYVARSVNFGQKESNNRYWGTQANEVAQGGIENAIAWVKYKYSAGASIGWVESTVVGACPPFKFQKNDLFIDVKNSSEFKCKKISDEVDFFKDWYDVNVYSVNVFLALNEATSPNVAWIYSSATNLNNGASAVLEQKMWIPNFGSPPPGTKSGTNAPLVVNGCTSNFTGQPDIYTCVDDPATAENECPSKIAVKSLNLKGQSKTACLDLGHLDITDGQNVVPTANVPNYLAGEPGGACVPDKAWKEIFGDPDNGGISKDRMKALSNEQAAAGLTNSTKPKRSVYWVDSSSNWHDSLGSEKEPVVLIFSKTACASGCPKVNGGPTIYGIVYLDTDCDETRSNGWGGATIYGTVAVESDMEKLNANTEIHHLGNAGNGLPPSPPADSGVTSTNVGRVQGSWKDWNQ